MVTSYVHHQLRSSGVDFAASSLGIDTSEDASVSGEQGVFLRRHSRARSVIMEMTDTLPTLMNIIQATTNLCNPMVVALCHCVFSLKLYDSLSMSRNDMKSVPVQVLNLGGQISSEISGGSISKWQV